MNTKVVILCIPVKILIGFSVELRKIILKFTQAHKKPRITITILKKKKSGLGLIRLIRNLLKTVILAYSR